MDVVTKPLSGAASGADVDHVSRSACTGSARAAIGTSDVAPAGRAMLDDVAMAASLNPNGLRQSRGGSVRRAGGTRKRSGQGRCVSVSEDRGGSRILKKKQ